jgi:hypothetical protein
MCIHITDNNKPVSHPLVRVFPELYRVTCLRNSIYHNDEASMCENCWNIDKPSEYKIEINHGFLDGDAISTICLIVRSADY